MKQITLTPKVGETVLVQEHSLAAPKDLLYNYWITTNEIEKFVGTQTIAIFKLKSKNKQHEQS